ncbi:hypothetical protein MNEG_1617, partial [Monoraphidium neglectum]
SPAGSGDDWLDSESLVSLPIFALPTCLHPGQTGAVRVFEPRYLTLFRDQQRQRQEAALAAADPNNQPAAERRAPPAPPALRFGHVLAPDAAPPALLEGSVGGLPSVGVYARVTKVDEVQDGTLLVHYEGARRFKLLAVDRDQAPYPVAAVQWYDDDTASRAPQARADVDALERDVFKSLAEVQRLSQRLGPSPSGAASGSGGGGGGGELLPPEVARFAPPPPPPAGGRSTADYLRAAGVPAGEAIAVWQRHGSVYGTPAAPKNSAADPYEHLREKVGKERRQELFSFAAANCLELGLVERLALLLSQDTAARLAYVAAATRPYLSDLAARVAVKGAVGGGGS